MSDPQSTTENRSGMCAATISRRSILKTGGALTGAAVAMPYYFSRRASAQGEPLSFWQFYAPDGPVPAQTAWFEELVADWNAANETQIELEFVPTPEYVNGSKLQTAFASGEGPDIFIISPGDFLRYYNGGVLTDLTPYMDQAAVADFYPEVMATRGVDGKIYGLPMEVGALAMYYSVAAFEEAGLTDADIPTTWDQLFDVADRVKTDERFGVLFETAPGYYQNFTWYPFMWQGGSDAVAEGGSSSAFNTDGAIQALQFWRDTIDRGLAPRTILGNGGSDLVANLVSGYCAIQNFSSPGVAALRANAPDFEYGVFKLPVPPNGTYTTGLGGWAFVANAKGKDPETAARFVVSAIGSMDDTSVQRVVDWCTKAKSMTGPRKSVMDRATAAGAYAEGAMKVFAEQVFPGGRAEPRYPPEVYKAISDAIQACQLNDAEPTQAAEQAARQIDAFLASYSGATIV